jgi:hypothetical protein
MSYQCARQREANLVKLDVPLQALRTTRIEIVGPHGAALLRSRDRERPDACKAIHDYVVRAEGLNQSRMLVLEARVPVDFGEVEVEAAALL